MDTSQKQKLKLLLSFLVVSNTVLFLVMAYFHLLSTDPNSAVFVDFWGRFTVYSLWFIGFALYLKYTSKSPALRWLVLTIIGINIPFFLLLAYFDKISNTPDMIFLLISGDELQSIPCGLCVMKLTVNILLFHDKKASAFMLLI